MTTAQLVALALGAAVSPITGLLTKAHASARVKAFVNLALSTLAGVVATVTLAPHASWQSITYNVGYAWVVSIATHYGLWKPAGVTAAVAGAAPNVGLGSNDGATDDTSEGPPDGYDETPKTPARKSTRRTPAKKTTARKSTSRDS